MHLTERVLAALQRVRPAEEASAHCDIPCGIYDPHQAQLAALTVVRMVQLIQAAMPPQPGSASKEEIDNYLNSMARYIAVKEEHAKIVEHEVIILWTDYFKPEHVQQYPELHDLVWKTCKLTSTVKQQINMEASQQLLDHVQQIADIFWATKGAKVRRQPSRQTAGGELVYPEP